MHAPEMRFAHGVSAAVSRQANTDVAARAAMSPERATAKYPLLEAALRGISQYAHLMSVEFFGDLNAELLRLLRAPGLPFPTRLQVLLTTSDILRCELEQRSPGLLTAPNWPYGEVLLYCSPCIRSCSRNPAAGGMHMGTRPYLVSRYILSRHIPANVLGQ